MSGEIMQGMADTIAELEQKLAEREWIPCSERLPEDNRDVLMCLEWGIDIGTYDRGEWHSEWINHYDDDNVIAWQPLPEPYEGSDTE